MVIARRIKKYAPRIGKVILVFLLIVASVLGSFVVLRNDKKISNEAEAVSTTLGLQESLDTDVDPGSGYVSLYKKEHSSQSDGVYERFPYQFLTAAGKAAAATVQFGSSSTTGSPQKGANQAAGIQTFYKGDANYWKNLLVNAPSWSGAQYNTDLESNNLGTRGYFFVTNMTGNSIDCSRQFPLRKNVVTNGNVQTVSPTSNIPIYYRFARGRVQDMFSAGGYVVALVESRIYYDNVCSYYSYKRGNNCDTSGLSDQHADNVSIALNFVVVYNPNTRTWSTVHIMNPIYKTAFFPVGSSGRYDIVGWGFSRGTMGPSVSIGNPTGVRQCDGAQYDSWESPESYDKDYGGSGLYASVMGISDVFGARTFHYGRLYIKDDSRTLSDDAVLTFDQFKPVYLRDPSDGGNKLFIGVTSSYKYRRAGDRGYILRFSSADRVDWLGDENSAPQNQWTDYKLRRIQAGQSNVNDDVYYRMWKINSNNTGGDCVYPINQVNATNPAYWNTNHVHYTTVFGDTLNETAQENCIGQLTVTGGQLYMQVPLLLRVSKNTDCSAAGYDFSAIRATAFPGLVQSGGNWVDPVKPGTVFYTNFAANPNFFKVWQHDIDGDGSSGGNSLNYRMLSIGSGRRWMPVQNDGNIVMNPGNWTSTSTYSDLGVTRAICFPNNSQSNLPLPSPLSIPIKPFGSSNYLLYDRAQNPTTGFMACGGGVCDQLSATQSYNFKINRGTINVSIMAGSFQSATTNVVAVADDVSADHMIFIGFEGGEPICLAMTVSTGNLYNKQSVNVTVTLQGSQYNGQTGRLYIYLGAANTGVPAITTGAFNSSGVSVTTLQYGNFPAVTNPTTYTIHIVPPTGTKESTCMANVTVYPSSNVYNGTMSCTQNAPYSTNIVVNARSNSGYVNYYRAYVIPKSAAPAATIPQGTAGSASALVFDSNSNTPFATNSAGYSVVNGGIASAFAGGIYYTTWNVRLNLPYNQASKQFYLNGGFTVYIMLQENPSGINNVNAAGGVPLANVAQFASYDPIEGCANPSFGTQGGDVRTNEPGASGLTFTGNTVGYGTSFNKYWQNTSADKKNAQAYPNPIKPISDFTFEYPTADVNQAHGFE